MLIVYPNDSNITVGILVEYYVQYYVIIITKNEFGEKGIPKKKILFKTKHGKLVVRM